MTKNLIKQIMFQKPEEKDAFDTKGFIAKLESGYLAQAQSKYDKKKAFSPSKLVYGEGRCARYWYLAFEGGMFENFADAYAVANMQSGTKSHERVLDGALKQSGMAIDVEFNVKTDDGLVYGFCDGLINWNDEDYVLELKTCSNESFEYLRNKMKARTYNIEQLLIYMKVLNKGKGIILYENKNTHELLPIVIVANEHYKQWVDNLFTWMKEVKGASEAKQLPVKTYRSNAKVCKTCPLVNECLKADTGVIRIEPLEELSEAM